jgi:hypothetical protein
VSLCAAGLHEWVDPSLIGGVTVDPMTLAAAVVADNGPLTQVLPEAFTTFWLDAWKNAYPSAPAEESSVFDATSLNAGYLMTWLVLWFQTSGAVIGCNPSPPQTPPSTCSAADNQAAQQWDNPTMINPATGEPYQPVVTKPVHDPRVAETVCGVILAILGAAATALGGAGFGIPLILGGIGLAVDGEEQLNWDQLECNLYWLNMYLWNGLDALRKIAILGGFQYPEATDLAISGYTSIAYGAEALSYLSAPTMCQSQSLDKILAPWGASLVTASGGMFVASWTSYPTGAAEEYNPPALPVWDRPGLWPCAFIDDPQHRNPATANILNSPADYDSGVEGSFGPALANAARVIDAASKGTAPPNWNLDGDRGLGWATWQLQAPYSSTISDPLQTERES